MNEWEKIFTYMKTKRTINKFIKILMKDVSNDMLELMKGKSIKNIEDNQNFKSKIEFYTDYLINKFTYKEWKIILSTDNIYKKMSNNKSEDVRLNLKVFLSIHYIEIYKMFNMRTFAKYQKKSMSDIYRIVYIQDGYMNNEKVSGVFIHYKDNSRICYNCNTKERLISELVEVKSDTLLITLVENTKTFLEKIKDFFVEEV